MGRGFVAFFLPLGCIGLSSSFIVVSLVMFLFYKFKYSLEIEFHKFIDNRFVKYSYGNVYLDGLYVYSFNFQ